jgi:hypothetical protein
MYRSLWMHPHTYTVTYWLFGVDHHHVQYDYSVLQYLIIIIIIIQQSHIGYQSNPRAFHQRLPEAY